MPKGMHPLVIGAISVAALSFVGSFAKERRFAAAPSAPNHASPTNARPPLPCPPRSIPEGTACIPLPKEAGDPTKKHAQKPNLRTHEAIPRRPDRPADLARLTLPLPPETTVAYAPDMSLDAEDPASREDDVAVDLAGDRGAEVKLVPLAGETGRAEVLAVGDLFGKTVVTLHHVTEGGQDRTYLVFFARLDAVAPDIAAEKKLDPGDTIGFVGDSGTSGFVHLHVEIRQVRPDIDVRPLDIAHLVDQAVTIPVDVRNLFVEHTP